VRRAAQQLVAAVRQLVARKTISDDELIASAASFDSTWI